MRTARLWSVLSPQLLGEVECLKAPVAPDDGSADEQAALACLAMAWLLQPELTSGSFEAVFSGSRSRSMGFAFAVQHICNRASPVTSRWDTSIAAEHYAALVPYLFIGDQAQAIGTPETRLTMEACTQLITYLCEVEPQRSQGWLRQWQQLPQFELYKDWMAKILTEAKQQEADVSWRGLDRAECDAVLNQNATLVRDAVDLKWLLEELLESRVAPSFKTDYSLTPLLWGKKSEIGGRPRADEKALQTAVYALLRMQTRSAPVIGAREPEQFDGKKPDLRLSFLVNGQQLDVPVEIKWSDHPELWTAPADQLLTKYMRAHTANDGLYVVGWCGHCTPPPRGLSLPGDPESFRTALQDKIDNDLRNSGKAVRVYVLDITVTE
jgi:hypothetical protein